MNSDYQLLTVEDVAKYLNVSVGTVRNLINGGDLEAVRVGRSVRIRPEAVEAFLQPVTEVL